MRVIITGGASGIGLATAQRLLARGDQVIVWDVQSPPADLNAEFHTVDCTEYAQVSDASQAADTFDAVIHCAGILRTGLFQATAPEAHAQTVAVNLTGTLNVAHATLPGLRQSRGSLMLIASVSAFYGPPEFASYAATKAAVLNLAQALRIELAGSGVVIGVVAPNLVDTPMLDAENRRNAAMTRARSIFLKTYQPDDIAEVILRGMQKRQFLIFPDWRSRLIYLISRYAAFVAYRLTVRTWDQARR